jgi:Flp pilus assembly CpaE family ATPase
VRAVDELVRLREDALEGAPMPSAAVDDGLVGDYDDAFADDEALIGDGLMVEERDSEADETEARSPAEAAAVAALEAIDGVSVAAPHDPIPVPARQRRENAALITVASATGGCGKTFFATNLASIIASAGYRCLLVDLDLQFGEVAAALRIRHPYSVYDGLYDGNGRALPPGTLDDHLDSLVVHHALGFDVLTAPRDPALADYVGARDATTIIDAVEEHYDVVVIDTPPSLNEVVLTALDRSEVVTVLATLDVPSLKNLTVFLDTLARLRLDRSLLRLVLNKVEPDIGISVGQAQDAFEGRFLAQIPLARGVSRSINAGTVVVELEPRAPVAQQLRRAARAILPEDMPLATPTAAAKTSPLSRLFTALRPSRRATTGGAS